MYLCREFKRSGSWVKFNDFIVKLSSSFARNRNGGARPWRDSENLAY